MEIKHEKILCICFFVVLFSCIAMLFTDCKSTGNIDANATSIIDRNSRASGQLEATITELDGTVNDSRDRIANIIETSRNIEDGIDRLEYLFIEYESEVYRILDEIDRIRAEIKIQSENNIDSGNSSVSRIDSKDSITNTEN